MSAAEVDTSALPTLSQPQQACPTRLSSKERIGPLHHQSGQFDTTGQEAPPLTKVHVTCTTWDDEKTRCLLVESMGVLVARREDNQMINGTKLLNSARMTRGRRDGILKSEKVKHVVKIGPMPFKGVWIPFDRALELANKEKVTGQLYPLFVDDISSLLDHEPNRDTIRTDQNSAASTSNVVSLLPPESGTEVGNLNFAASSESAPVTDSSEHPLSPGHPVDRENKIARWQESACTDVEEETGGIILRLVRVCVDSVSYLVARIDVTTTVKRDLRTLRRCQATLKLWADGHGVWQGELDGVLEKSRNLRHTTLSILNSLCKVLLYGLNKYVDGESNDAVLVLLRTNLAQICDRTRWLLLRPGDSLSDSETEDESESETNSDKFEGTLEDDKQHTGVKRMVDEVRTLVGCLTDLSTAIEKPAIDPEDKDEPSALDVEQRVAHGYHTELIKAKYPEAQLDLVECLGLTSWNRYQQLRQERETNVNLLNPPDVDEHNLSAAKSQAESSRFRDSGLGSSLPSVPPSRYAETIISFMTSIAGGKRVQLPPLSAEAKTGALFECSACGRLIRATNESMWRQHLYRDLQPYTCFHANCAFSAVPFSDRQLWSSHLELDHNLGPQWDSIECPLCHKNTGQGKNAVLAHLGRHMEDIAVIALPREVESEDESDGGSVPSRTSTESERGGSGLDAASDETNVNGTLVAMDPGSVGEQPSLRAADREKNATQEDNHNVDEIKGPKNEVSSSKAMTERPPSGTSARAHTQDLETVKLVTAVPTAPFLSASLTHVPFDRTETEVTKCFCDSTSDDGGYIQCDVCKTWQHLKCFYESEKHTPETHKCTDCDPRVISRNTVVSDVPIPFQRPHIMYTRTGRISKAKKGLKVHTCHCGRSYTREEHLRNHLRKTHSNDEFPCRWPGCGEVYHRIELLQKHEERHKNTESKTVSSGDPRIIRPLDSHTPPYPSYFPTYHVPEDPILPPLLSPVHQTYLEDSSRDVIDDDDKWSVQGQSGWDDSLYQPSRLIQHRLSFPVDEVEFHQPSGLGLTPGPPGSFDYLNDANSRIFHEGLSGVNPPEVQESSESSTNMTYATTKKANHDFYARLSRGLSAMEASRGPVATTPAYPGKTRRSGSKVKMDVEKDIDNNLSELLAASEQRASDLSAERKYEYSNVPSSMSPHTSSVRSSEGKHQPRLQRAEDQNRLEQQHQHPDNKTNEHAYDKLVPRLTEDQKDTLEQHFQQQHKPSAAVRKDFAEKLQVPLTKIDGWFQNRRAKEKQNRKRESSQFESAHDNMIRGSLPSGWMIRWDNEYNKFYYVQISTGIIQWHRPTDEGLVGSSSRRSELAEHAPPASVATREGCYTCHIADVPCDMTKPRCLSCQFSGFLCRWEKPTPLEKSEEQRKQDKALDTIDDQSKVQDPQAADSTQRSREMRASCENCAQAKVKCDKTIPICHRCGNMRLACSYGHSMRSNRPRRNRNPDGTIMRDVSSTGHDGFNMPQHPPLLTADESLGAIPERHDKDT